MGKVMSVLSRKVKRYNVENRAHKVISQDKPAPAPRHKPSAKEIEIMKEADRDFLKKHNTKDLKLDDHLKNVYLVSHATEMLEKVGQANPDRPLPTQRKTVDGSEYGVYEPANVKRGKCTLRQAVQFLTDFTTDPEKHTAAAIAAEYKLSVESTSNILKYFALFKIYIPQAKPAETKPSLSQLWKQKDKIKIE